MSTTFATAPIITNVEHEKKICLECDRPDPRLNVPIQGMEQTIIDALKGFEQNTFNNCWEYLIYILDIPQKPEYGETKECDKKVLAILSDWAAINGDKSTVALLTCCLRQHRSIVNKIRREALLALGYTDNLPMVV